MQETLKLFSYFENPYPRTQNQQNMTVIAHGAYPSIASGGTNLPAKFRGIFGIIRGVSEFVIVYFKISHKNPKDILRNSRNVRNHVTNYIQGTIVIQQMLSLLLPSQDAGFVQ